MTCACKGVRCVRAVHASQDMLQHLSVSMAPGGADLPRFCVTVLHAASWPAADADGASWLPALLLTVLGLLERASRCASR